MSENSLNEFEINELEINEPNVKEVDLKNLDLEELKDYLNNTDLEDIDLDALLDVKLLEKVSIDEVKPGLIAYLLNDNKMITDTGKTYQVTAKTTRGNKIAYTLLNGSNHDKIDELLSMKENAINSSVAVAFNDNITVIENSLDAIKSQVQAISKGIMGEETRYKTKFIDPINVKMNELFEDVVNNELLQAQVNKLEVENEKLGAEVSELRDKRDANKVLIENQEKAINELTAESRELIKASKEFDNTLKNATKSLQEDIDSKADTIKTLEKENQTLKLKLDQYEVNENSLKEELKQVKVDCSGEISNLKSLNAESERKLNSQIVQLNISINKLESDNASYKKDNESLSNEVTKLRGNAVEDTKSIKELDKTVKTLTVENESLKVQVAGKDALIESNKNIMSNNETTINNLNSKISDLENLLAKEIRLRQEKEHEVDRLNIMVETLRKSNELNKSNTNVVADAE